MSQRHCDASKGGGGAGSSTRVTGWPLHHSASVREAHVYLTTQSKSEQLNVPEQLVLHYPCVSQ